MCQVHFLSAATDNMISGHGMHPGDIITAANGKTIEVGTPTLGPAPACLRRDETEVSVGVEGTRTEILVLWEGCGWLLWSSQRQDHD